MSYEDYCIYASFAPGMSNGSMILLGMGPLAFCALCPVKALLICIHFDCWSMHDESCTYNVMFILEAC